MGILNFLLPHFSFEKYVPEYTAEQARQDLEKNRNNKREELIQSFCVDLKYLYNAIKKRSIDSNMDNIYFDIITTYNQKYFQLIWKENGMELSVRYELEYVKNKLIELGYDVEIYPFDNFNQLWINWRD